MRIAVTMTSMIVNWLMIQYDGDDDDDDDDEGKYGDEDDGDDAE